MLESYIKSSNIIEMIEEGSSEDETMHKVLFRVVGPSEAWSRLMLTLLRAPDDDSDFMVSIRKEYYIDDANKPTFVWVLVIYGDLDEAFSEIGPLLSVAAPKKTTKRPAVPETKKSSPAVQRKTYRSEDGVRTVSKIALPFRRGNRDDTGKVKTLANHRGVGAFVSNVTTDRGL